MNQYGRVMINILSSYWKILVFYLFIYLEIADIQANNKKPLKHKAYNQWYLGDWHHGRPKGKGILYNKINSKNNKYYEG